MTVPVTQRPATAHGWLRRPELDGKNYDTWELPNGQLQAVQKGHVLMLMTLEVPPLSLLAQDGTDV
jgi:hypothetical protein